MFFYLSFDHIYKNWVIPTVEKSVKNYVEWYVQSAQRLIFRRLYAGDSVFIKNKLNARELLLGGASILFTWSW